MSGGGGGQKSGGGGGGKQSWSSYMEKIHETMLRGSYYDTDTSAYVSGLRSTDADDYTSEGDYISVIRDVVEAHASSPFSGETAYNPATRIAAMTTAKTAFKNVVDALDEDGDYEGAFDTVEARVELTLTDESLQASVDSYDALMNTPILNALHRLLAAEAAANASNSSAFILGRVMLEREHLQNVTKFSKDLVYQAYKDKLQMIQSGISQVLDSLKTKCEMNRQLLANEIEIQRMAMIAEKEQSIREVELAVKDIQWELEVWQYAANILASISGAVGSPTHAVGKESDGGSGLMSQLAGATGGALSGGAAGATLGMAGGPFAFLTVPGGAALGGLLGGLGGFMGS